MLGIEYASSDEEEPVSEIKQKVRPTIVPKGLPIATNIELVDSGTTAAPPSESHTTPAPLEPPQIASNSLNGPQDAPSVLPPPGEEDLSNDAPPGSPFTSNRALIQNLTLPTVPNFDIPPSPPGSPPQKATRKFAQFLELKKKGQHFNQRLENSSVLRDPSHLEKLMDFVGINEEEMYTSTLSDDVSIPTVFPEWAYVEELKAAQKRITKSKEKERSKAPRDAIDFVSATKSGTSSGTGTPSGKGQRQSAAERVMADVDREHLSRTSSQNAAKRKQLEHRGRDDAMPKSGLSSGSRSPKRRRSRSRDRK